MNLKKLLDQFDVVSGAVLFLIAGNVIAQYWYALIKGLHVDGALVGWSLSIVAAHTTHSVMTNKTDPPK